MHAKHQDRLPSKLRARNKYFLQFYFRFARFYTRFIFRSQIPNRAEKNQRRFLTKKGITTPEILTFLCVRSQNYFLLNIHVPLVYKANGASKEITNWSKRKEAETVQISNKRATFVVAFGSTEPWDSANIFSFISWCCRVHETDESSAACEYTYKKPKLNALIAAFFLLPTRGSCEGKTDRYI